MKYRKEIDGLRGIAVSAIVVFHFFQESFRGGYLGVDIFFVISGFLITGHLVEKKYSFKYLLINFYKKRAKRIFPALFVFFLISTFFLFAFLTKKDFLEYFLSLISAKTFWSNWYFWRDGGYWGSENELKPLLHTWSLSVEEQFYLIYPLFIFIIFYIFNKIIKPIYFLVLLTVLSFGIWFFLNRIGGENPAFFLLPTRIWQFGLGGIVAIIYLEKKINFKFNNSFIFILSLSLICLGLNLNILIHENRVLQTILVTIGTSLFFFFKSNNKNFFFLILSNSPIMWLGKISYSFYLYHWPIAVFLLYVYVGENIPFIVSTAGLILSLLLAYLSYRFVELPFRYILHFRYTVLIIILSTLINFSFFKIVDKYQTESLADNLSASKGTNFRCKINFFFIVDSVRGCYLNKTESNTQIALLGNSHAQMYGALLTKILKEKNQNGIMLITEYCLPTLTVNLRDDCFEKAENMLQYVLKNKKIKKIFIGLTWHRDQYFDKSGKVVNNQELIESVLDLLEILKKNNKNVYIFSPIPMPDINLPSVLPRMLKFNKINENEINKFLTVDKNEFINLYFLINEKLQNNLKNNYIKVYEDLCDENACYFGNKEIVYFSDIQHLSISSSIFLKKTYLRIKNIIN